MCCIRFTVTALLLLLFSFSDQAVSAGEPVAFDKQLPANTYVFFRISDTNLLKTKFQETVLWKFLKDPEMKPFFSQFEGKANEKWTEMSAQVEENLGISLQQLLSIPQGEVGIALLTPPRKDLAIAIKVSFGENESTVKGVLTKVNESLKEDGSEIGTVESNGLTLTTIKFVDSEEANVVYGIKDKQLLMASSMAAMESILERWDGKGERTFGTAVNRMSVVDELKAPGETPLIEWYLNPIDLARVSAKYAGEQAAAINMGMGFLPIIGLDQLKAIGGYIDLNCNNMDSVIKTQFVIETPLRGMMNFFVFPEDTHTPPAFVKENTLSYQAFNWDVTAAYTSVESVVDSFQGPGAFESMVDSFAKSPQMNGIHLKKDIFDNINGKVMMTSVDAKSETADTVNYFTTLGFKDAAVAKGLLEKVAGLEGLVDAIDIGGQYAIELPDSLGELEENPVKFIVAGKNEFIFAATKAQVEEFLKGAKNTKPLADSAKFKNLRKNIPEKVSMLMMELATPKEIEAEYNKIKENGMGDLLEDLPIDEFKDLVESIDFSKMPDFSVVNKYYTPNAAYIKSNSKGCAMNYIFLKN